MTSIPIEKDCDINYIKSNRHKFYNKNGCNYIIDRDDLYYLNISIDTLNTYILLETKLPCVLFYKNMKSSKGYAIHHENTSSDFTEIDENDLKHCDVINKYLFLNNKQVYEAYSFYNEKILITIFHKMKVVFYGLMPVFEQIRIHDLKTKKMIYNSYIVIDDATNTIVMEFYKICKYKQKILKKRKLETSTDNIEKILDFYYFMTDEQNSF